MRIIYLELYSPGTLFALLKNKIYFTVLLKNSF
jgi:hypothetical protein